MMREFVETGRSRPFFTNPQEGNTMRSGHCVILMAMMVCALPAPALAQSTSDWVDIKDPNELRALYSNKTFRGNGWVGHYRADGKGVFISQGGKPEPRTWEVKGSDWVCVAPSEGPANCFRFQRNRKKPNELKGTNVATGRTASFTLEDGIPKF